MTKLEDLLVNKGLYEAVEITEDDYDDLNRLFKKSFIKSIK